MLKNMKIGTKIIIVILIISIAFTVVNVAGLMSLNKVSQDSREMYEQETRPIVDLAKIDALYLQSTVILRDIVLKGFSEDRKSEAENLKNVDASIDQMITDIEQNIDHDEKIIVATIKESLEKYRLIRQEAIDFAVNGTSLTAKYAYQYIQSQNTQNSAQAVQDAISALQSKFETDAKMYYEKNNNLVKATQTATIIVIAASLLGAVMLGILLSGNLVKRARKLEAAAKKLAAGDMTMVLDAESEDEIGILVCAVQSVVGAVKELVADVNMLTVAAKEGRLDTRVDADKHTGDFKNIIQGVNNTLDIIAEKNFWYENILDSMPHIVAVTNLDMNIEFVNKKAEKLLGIVQEDSVRKKCENWKTDICNTENCAIERLRVGKSQTHFKHKGINLKANSAFVYNRKGEQVGQIESIEDVTPEIRSAEYSQWEVERLAENLRLLSEGRLDLNFDVTPGDEYTEPQRRNFEEINHSFQTAVHSIAGYIGEISRVLRSIAKGDLTIQVKGEFKGEFAEMKDSINSIVNSLNNMILDINIAADQVASGSIQVSGGNQAISQGAAEQAGSLEEISAAITDISQQVRDNAEKSNSSKEMGMYAEQLAEKCNGMMKEMLVSMEKINVSSENVTKIIRVIDDIAFQTNILALNAAVEAAHAGVYGKGFAVVAEEVRNLAGKSADAAQSTTELIEGSLKKIEEGTRIANETAAALDKIVEGSKIAVRLEEEIAMASNEQAAKILQVNKGIEQLSQVIQNNSATAEEGAAASQELTGQAELLKEKIGFFLLKENNQDHQEYIELKCETSPAVIPDY